MPSESNSCLSTQNGHMKCISQPFVDNTAEPPLTIEKSQLQRLIDLTAMIARFNLKISLGINHDSAEFDLLTDSNREFADLIGELKLRFPS